MAKIGKRGRGRKGLTKKSEHLRENRRKKDNVRSLAPDLLSLSRSFSLSLSLRGSIHFTSGNTCASAAPHFRQETFYRCRFLTAREITLYAANSQKTRKRIVVSLSGMHSEECSRVNVTRRRVTNARGSLISPHIFRRMTRQAEKQVSCIAKPLSPCYAPAEKMYFNFVSTNQNRRN